MRILALGDLPPFVLGGAEQQMQLLAQAWGKTGHEVLVLGHRTQTGVYDGVPARRIRVIYRGGRLLRGITFSLSLGWNLLRECGRADIIYCRFLGEAAIVATVMKALRLVKTPLVVTPAAAGKGVHSDMARLRSMRLWPMIRKALRRHVQTFNAISPAIHDDLRQAGLSPVSNIANGVSSRDTGQTARSAPALEDRFWMFCGRLEPQKGADLLLEALAIAGKGVPSLVLVGEGPEEPALREIAERLDIMDRLSFRGRLSHSEALNLMRAAYALVLPSRYEGLSNAALEALSTGLPVISTRCGGIDAYLDNATGWVCDATPQSLADSLRDAAGASSARWEDSSRRSRALVERVFAIDTCAAQHLALFSRLIHR